MRVERGASGEENGRARGEPGALRWLDLVFRQVPGAAWATDRELRLLWVLGRIPGVRESSSAFIGRTVFDYVDSTDESHPAIAGHRAALEGRRARFCYSRSGRWYEVVIEPLSSEDGVIGTVGSGWDVTEQVAARDELEKAVSLLTATLNSTADGILVVDREGRITAVNDRFLELWRLPRRLAEAGDDERLIRAVLEQLEDPDGFLARVRALYASPGEESLDEVRFLDGSVFERYSRPQRVGDEIVGRVWSFRDMSERVSLLARHMFLSDGSRLLATLDVEEALRAIAALALGTLAEACAVDLFEQEGPRRLFTLCRDTEPAELALACAAPPTRPQLYTGRGRSWMSVPVLSQQRPLAAIRVVAPLRRAFRQSDLDTLVDLAARIGLALENARAHADAQAALRARDEVLAIAAHEIRGPLTSMRLAVQTLRMKTGAKDENAVFTLLERETRRLARFVDELLEAVHMRGGVLTLRLEEVALDEVIREVVARMAEEVRRSGSRLTVVVDKPVVGVWDRDRLDQAIGNLLSNALKYGLGRPVTIKLDKDEEKASVTVTDEGSGITKERLENLFEPFERGVSSRHYGGLGLGLYIVRSVAESLGGGVEVETEIGAGSTFRLWLPLARRGA